jgi:hypothetical protein
MLAKQIEEDISRMSPDIVFTYRDLGYSSTASGNVIRKLNRMVESGVLMKLSKGRYYKPRNSVFGQLRPRQEEIVKDLLWLNGRPVGYLTGYSIFNQLGLTTQISNIIEIGSNVRRNKKRRGNFEIRFILQPNDITLRNIPLLQILDAVKYIKIIPDSNVMRSYIRLRDIISRLDDKSKRSLVTLAMNYQPMVRALTGSLLEHNVESVQTEALYSSLNPITYYQVGLSSELPVLKKWRLS